MQREFPQATAQVCELKQEKPSRSQKRSASRRQKKTLLKRKDPRTPARRLRLAEVTCLRGIPNQKAGGAPPGGGEEGRPHPGGPPWATLDEAPLRGGSSPALSFPPSLASWDGRGKPSCQQVTSGERPGWGLRGAGTCYLGDRPHVRMWARMPALPTLREDERV